MDEILTVEAKPLESVLHSCYARTFNHEADRSRYRPLRRMAQVWWKQKNIAFTDSDVFILATIDYFENHVTFHLVEEFFDGIVVKIYTLVRATYNHHNHALVVRKKHFVANRRLERMLVFCDPGLEIEGFLNHW